MNCRRILFLILPLMITACSSPATAPIVNGWHEPISKQGVYIVRPGDGLYAIAWRYGLDYRSIVRINHLSEPYTLYTGQKLYLVQPTPQEKEAIAAAAAKPAVAPAKKTTQPVVAQSTPKPQKASPAVAAQPAKKAVPVASAAATSSLAWQWPAAGQIVQGFDGNSGQNKGINIVNSAGTPIKAAAGGQVVYSGSGLPGYGYLIIIKHNENYLSAYAHNSAVLVKEGQKVKAGQVIARMGNTGADRVMLHFEIRFHGQPIDPQSVLPKH